MKHLKLSKINLNVRLKHAYQTNNPIKFLSTSSEKSCFCLFRRKNKVQHSHICKMPTG